MQFCNSLRYCWYPPADMYSPDAIFLSRGSNVCRMMDSQAFFDSTTFFSQTASYSVCS
uniref:Uncharacterized protein n=1 Tax=Anguilla anguilla TaxID=7936 RepID=A0A0E9XSM1_ANGAN